MLGEGRGVLNYNVFLGRRTCKLASLYQLGRTSLLISSLGFYVKTTLDPGKQGRRSKVPSDGINIQFTAASRREDLIQLGGREAASEVFENELWKGSLQNSVIRVRLANQFRTFHHQPHTKLLKSLHPLGQWSLITPDHSFVYPFRKHLQGTKSTRSLSRSVSFGSAPKYL